MRVKLSEPCVLDGAPYKKDDVVEVAENIQQLNAGWMKPTHEDLTDPDAAPSAEDLAEDNRETAPAVEAGAKKKK
ncbi:MAG: hypothetical protein JO053_01470 [Acidobacteria bacterium]|nr:hypothetical protein [Acidobacteriota bacterium]